MVSVAAVDRDRLARASRRNDQVEISAPGYSAVAYEIVSTLPDMTDDSWGVIYGFESSVVSYTSL